MPGLTQFRCEAANADVSQTVGELGRRDGAVWQSKGAVREFPEATRFRTAVGCVWPGAYRSFSTRVPSTTAKLEKLYKELDDSS